MKLISTQVFHRKHSTGIAPIELHTVEFDREISPKLEPYVVTGLIFPFWQRIENLLRKYTPVKEIAKVKMVCLETTENRKIGGVLMPKRCVGSLIKDLEKDSVKIDG